MTWVSSVRSITPSEPWKLLRPGSAAALAAGAATAGAAGDRGGIFAGPLAATGGSGRRTGATGGSSPSSSLMRAITVARVKSPVTVMSTPASVAASAMGRSRPAKSRNGVSFVAGSRRTIVNSS